MSRPYWAAFDLRLDPELGIKEGNFFIEEGAVVEARHDDLLVGELEPASESRPLGALPNREGDVIGVAIGFHVFGNFI